MIIIGILGDIGSGKSLLAKQFGYPVFNADEEVTKIYKADKSCFKKLNKILPNYIKSKPIKKKELSRAILENKSNLKKIVKIVHPLVRKRMRKFFKKNYKRKMVIIDVPLLIENKLHNKNFILVFVDAKKSKIIRNLKKRRNYNKYLLKNLRKLQKPIKIKKKLSHYVIKNNFNLLSLKNNVKLLKNRILNERNNT